MGLLVWILSRRSFHFSGSDLKLYLNAGTSWIEGIKNSKRQNLRVHGIILQFNKGTGNTFMGGWMVSKRILRLIIQVRIRTYSFLLLVINTNNNGQANYGNIRTYLTFVSQKVEQNIHLHLHHQIERPMSHQIQFFLLVNHPGNVLQEATGKTLDFS